MIEVFKDITGTIVLAMFMAFLVEIAKVAGNVIIHTENLLAKAVKVIFDNPLKPFAIFIGVGVIAALADYGKELA